MLALSALAMGCEMADAVFLSEGQRAAKMIGLDYRYSDMKIEKIYDDYELGDGSIVHKLTFTEDASALFEQWNELPTEDDTLRQCLYLAAQAWVSHGIKKGRWTIVDHYPERNNDIPSTFTAGVYDQDKNIAYIVEFYL